jgi:hypothetical protein
MDKTRWKSGTRPGSVVVVVYQHGSEIQYFDAVTYSSEDTRIFGFAGAFDGEPCKLSRSFGDGLISLHRVDESTFDSTAHAEVDRAIGGGYPQSKIATLAHLFSRPGSCSPTRGKPAPGS